MAWIRLDDQIAHHPKFLRSGPVCGWFFVCSLGFCQKFLTDGFIPDEAIQTIASVEHPRRCAESLVKSGLFEREDKGFRIHDYLQYNESATVVKARREADRVRKASHRIPDGIPTDSTKNPGASRARVPSHPILKKIPNSKNKLTPKPVVQSTNGNGSESGNGHKEPDATKTFLEWFHQQYKTDRHGADYLVHRKRDEPVVRELLKHFPTERLQKLAQIMLSENTDDSFIVQSDRGITILKIKANWLNDRLSAWEHRNAHN